MGASSITFSIMSYHTVEGNDEAGITSLENTLSSAGGDKAPITVKSPAPPTGSRLSAPFQE